MNKLQIGVIIGAALLFAGLYFGTDTKPSTPRQGVESGQRPSEATGSETVMEHARRQLNTEQAAELARKETAVRDAINDAAKLESLKDLSGWWYACGHVTAAGIVAEEVATLDRSDSAWSIAGATFFSGLTQIKDPLLRQYCADHAVQAFEKAASLNPDRVEHRVNLALVYAENPSPDDPMKAVMMLRDLEKRHPENASVYNALGRLAIKTAQWSRAVERLEKAWSIDPTNSNTPCLLSRAYEELGNAAKATAFAKLCK
jgi:Flp pilus assembly protein TadD